MSFLSSSFAAVFPGQGSQEPGMGKALAEAFPLARETFQEVDDALSQKLSSIMWGDDMAALTATENAQPAIMSVGLAVWRVLHQQAGRALPTPAFFAGHSLGEYSALCAAGVFTLADTARLLRTRGQAMQQAVPAGKGAMAVLLGLEIADTEDLLSSFPAGSVVLANDNAPGQVVISGETVAVQQAVQQAQARGAKRSMLLNVSAPFHSPMMAPAAIVMKDALQAVTMQVPAAPLIANVTAQPVSDVNAIRELLVEQVTGRVRWRETLECLQGQGMPGLLECGHGKVLSGLAKRAERGWPTLSLQNPQDIEIALAG